MCIRDRAICAHTAVPWVMTTGGRRVLEDGKKKNEEEEVEEGKEKNEEEDTHRAGSALVFGGFDGGKLHKSEPFMVEGSTLTVKEAAVAVGRTTTTPPEPRFAHAAVALPNFNFKGSAMLVFGGVTFETDLNDLTMWVDVDDNAAAPVSAIAFAAAAAPVAVPASDLD